MSCPASPSLLIGFTSRQATPVINILAVNVNVEGFFKMLQNGMAMRLFGGGHFFLDDSEIKP